jgi:hypothetical protein
MWKQFESLAKVQFTVQKNTRNNENIKLVFVPTRAADGDGGNIIVVKDGVATSAKPLQRRSALDRHGVKYTVIVPTPDDKSKQK